MEAVLTPNNSSHVDQPTSQETSLQILEQKASQSASKAVKKAKKAMQKAQSKAGVKLKQSNHFALKANALAVLTILAAGVAYFYKKKK
ncbi:hypothetical protein ACR31S_04405 [Streptococcus iniae]